MTFIRSIPALMILLLIWIAVFNQLGDDRQRKSFIWILFVVGAAIVGLLLNILRANLS